MTEITRENYQTLLPEIKEKIRNATFLSFDAEFSGLGQPSEALRNSLFDNGAERYKKLRSIVLYNTSPQIGFCIFRRADDDTANVFTVDAYQAYVCEPAFADFNCHDKILLSLEYKCSKFLRKCHFDFNAFSEKSVPFLNNNRVNELVEYLDRNPSFWWKHRGRYFDKVYFPPDERRGKQAFNEDDRRNIVKRLRGLSEIIDVIKEYRIPVVGHNIGLDLLYFYQMLCADLPEDYETFKLTVPNFLPHVFDTKFMIISCKKTLNSHPAYRNNQDKDKLESSGLFTAYSSTSRIGDQWKPTILLQSTCRHFEKSLELGRSSNSAALEKDILAHSPAFDACVTGVVFLNVSHITARIDKNFGERSCAPTKAELFENVQSWKDQIFISRASVNAMFLFGNDPKPCRPRWTEVRSKQEIDVSSIRKAMSVYGPVDIEPINKFAFRFAAAGGKSSRQMIKMLGEKGFSCKNMDIPFNNKAGKYKLDNVYDRSNLLG